MWTPSTRCPMRAALALRSALDMHCFVETGTAQGDTAFIAAGHFRRVHTIEIHADAYKVSGWHLQGCQNIVTRHLGDSMKVLPDILKELNGGPPALFWLDAHYSGGPTTIGETECPIIQEVRMIRQANPRHCMIIDDLQIFCATGKDREDKLQGWSKKWEDWPHVDAIQEEIHRHGPFFCMIKATDRSHVMCAVPVECERVLMENLQ